MTSRNRTLGLLASAVVMSAGVASPAYAELASDTFKDVPNGHWAEQGVAEVAVKRDLMRGYADGTFRGTLPFTRLELAQTMSELVRELEAISKTSLGFTRAATQSFADLPPGDDRTMVLRLANDYQLFEGIPGVRSARFEPNEPVTRAEVVGVFDNLLHRAEARDVVRTHPEAAHQFKDLTPRDASYPEIEAIANHYGVMIGFPDDTFRGRDVLTRYQFAQAASQAIPLIRALVVRTTEEKVVEQALERRWQGETPWHLEGQLGNGSYGGDLRWVGYPNGFVMSETSVSSVPGSNAALLDEQLGFFPWAPVVGAVHVQPYVGLSAGSAPGSSSFYGGGLGLALFYRATPEWGFLAHARESYLTGATASGMYLENGTLEAEYFIRPQLSVTGGVGFGENPVATTPSPRVQLGVSFGL